jgi:hypothetical protein
VGHGNHRVVVVSAAQARIDPGQPSPKDQGLLTREERAELRITAWMPPW